MNGILVINKPAGLTSHDVIDTLRKASGLKRIGHTGTLDPMATGVLVACLEQATRIIEFIPDDKEYEAVLQLGRTSDTLDKTGKILTEQAIGRISTAALKMAVKDLVGPIKQVPPMFSAVKIKGRKLYELARAGQSIPRPEREVKIHDLKITEIKLPFIHLKINCSSGTYIRSLAQTIGEKLGCGALLFDLVRSRVGPFGFDQAAALSKLNSLTAVKKSLKPTETGIGHLPKITLSPTEAQKIKNGQSLPINPLPDAKTTAPVRIYTGSSLLLGIGKIYQPADGSPLLKPIKVFNCR